MKGFIAALALAATCLIPGPSRADGPALPALSFYRLTIGGRFEQQWWSGRDSAVLPSFHFRHENGVGMVASYALVPKFALTGRIIYGLDSKLFNTALGVNFTFYDGPGKAGY